MKEKCDYCGESYLREGAFNTISEPIIIDKDEESFHIECWVRKKWVERGWAEEIDDRVCVFE